MSRGTTDGAVSPFPISSYLPAVFQEDSFAPRFTAGLDEVLAPAVGVLDCLSAYLDPGTTPEDFLPWLGSWLGLRLMATVPPARMRALIEAAPRLYASRCTMTGLREWLELMTGGDVMLHDRVRIIVSAVPSRGAHHVEPPHLLVDISVDDPARVPLADVDNVIALNKPVHVPHTLKVRPR
ncbi:phage tail protein [Lentzea sp. E54]|uniref:phage tail protein n=1 Tax=Lentzea xerophila TaxID=3435883 RepID=UPI003DA67E9A